VDAAGSVPRRARDAEELGEERQRPAVRERREHLERRVPARPELEAVLAASSR
jgi:hypothetical protein